PPPPSSPLFPYTTLFRSTTRFLRCREQALSADGEEIERDERGGRLARKLLDARCGGVQTHLQRVEVEAVGTCDDDLAVEHATGGQPLEKQRVQLREVAIQRLQVTALDVDVGAAAKDQRAKAVPLRLVEECAGGRQRVGQLREHRLDRRSEREAARAAGAGGAARACVRSTTRCRPRHRS